MNRFAAVTSALLITTTASAIDICVTSSTPIPDNGVEISIPIFIDAPENEVVDSISLDLMMTHEWVGDLIVQLRSPNGTIITLLDRPGLPSSGFPGPFGCGGRDIACTFTDTAGTPAESICSTTLTPVIAGPVIPVQPMGTFLNEPIDGLWELLISDQSPYDSGVVLQACISATTKTICIVDLNNDGSLDFFDVSAFLAALGNNDSIADLNDDGNFDFFDISAFLMAFQAGC